jgi:hypothetical protein
MTPLEDRVRQAIHTKAGEVPPGLVPPLRLPARRRRSLSPAYRGSGRTGAPARRRGWLVPAAAAVLLAVAVVGSEALSHDLYGRQAPAGSQQAAAAARNEAAAWVAAEVSPDAVVSCDPVMCRALAKAGVTVGALEELRPGTPGAPGSAVIVATAAVRGEFGARLSSVYAPAVIASFGSGTTRIQIRVIAPDGAAAYRSAFRADLAARQTAGAQLLRSRRISVSPTARRQLAVGQADTRLLVTIAVMAAAHRVSIVAFGDSGPGASAGTPLRSADLAAPQTVHSPGDPAGLHQMMESVNAQQLPYRPALAKIVSLPGGQRVLRIEFAAPSPLGLLDPRGSGGG